MANKYPDPFTRWEEWKREVADTLGQMKETAQEYDDAQREKEIIENVAERHGISLEEPCLAK